MTMAIAGALKRELIIRPKLAFTFMAMTTQSDPNTTCAKLAKDTAIIVAVFGSASNNRTRVQISYIRRPGSRSAAGLSPETRQCVGRFYSSQQKALLNAG